MDDMPRRKPQRLKDYAYSQNGGYFITMCAQNRLPIFGEIVGARLELNGAGKMVEEKLLSISAKNIFVEKFVVMPNHVHAILTIADDGTTQGSFPTISDVVREFKMITTRIYIDGVKTGAFLPFDKKIWQKSFHDHVIRGDEDYKNIWDYIDTNPLKWQDDCFYVK